MELEELEELEVGPKTGRVRFHAACQVVENVTTSCLLPLPLTNTHQILRQTFRFHSHHLFISHLVLRPGIFNDVWTPGSGPLDVDLDVDVLTGQNICGTPRGRAPGTLRHVTQHAGLVGEV